MTPVTAPPLPGSMTVPPLHGWEDLAAVLVLLVVVALAVGVVLSTGRSESSRSEWQAWLEGRSASAAAGVPDTGPEPRDTGRAPSTTEAPGHR